MMIYRCSSQIGCCCTQISTGENRILIDFEMNLPGSNRNAGIKDSEMFQKVFDSVRKSAVLFPYCHGDHYGLFIEIPDDVSMNTEHPEDFISIPEFSPYHDRVKVVRDGIRLMA